MKSVLFIVCCSVSTMVVAETSVYGHIHVSASKVSGSSLHLNSKNTRIGLKGINILGGGLRATHQIEFDYAFTQEEKILLVRHSWIGLRGGFGEFRVGRQTTPYSAIDNPVGFLQRDGQALHTDLQSSNTLAYLNKIDSFGFAASYIASDADDNGTANLLINYKTYPLYVGIAYQKMPSGMGEDGVKLALAHRDKNYAVGLAFEKTPKLGGKIETLSGKVMIDNYWFAGQYSKNKTIDIEQKNIEIGYKLTYKTNVYYEWEKYKGVGSSHLGLVHDF